MSDTHGIGILNSLSVGDGVTKRDSQFDDI